MWFHNAKQAVYTPVWVVLTNSHQVVGITYTGDNHPDGTSKPYYNRMPCTEVKGTLTRTAPLLLLGTVAGDHGPMLCPTAPRTLHALVGGLLPTDGTSFCLDTLEANVKLHTQKVDNVQKVDEVVKIGLKIANLWEDDMKSRKRPHEQIAR